MRKITYAIAGLGVYLLAIPAVSQTPIGLCSKIACGNSHSEYQKRLIDAWDSTDTTAEQRQKMGEYVVLNTRDGNIDWENVAKEYFSWRSGKPYSLAQQHHNGRDPHSVGQDQSETRAMIEAAIRDRLVDPESARFKWPYGFTTGVWKTPKKYEGRITCGSVNARNRMGGLTGDATFSVVVADDRIVFLDIDSAGESGLNEYMCKKAADSFPAP